jgi:hypothetical protein
VDGKGLRPIQGGPRINTCLHHVDQFDHVDFSQGWCMLTNGMYNDICWLCWLMVSIITYNAIMFYIVYKFYTICVQTIYIYIWYINNLKLD